MWLNDPVSKQPSVSLTLLIGSCVVLSVLGILESIGIVKSTSIFLELTMSFIALYFGRRVTFKGQVFETQGEQVKNESIK